MPMYKKRGQTRKVGSRRVGSRKGLMTGRRVRFAPRRSKSGYFKIVRKLPEFWLQNTATANQCRLGWIGSGGTEVQYTGTTAQLGALTAGMNGSVDIPFAMNFRLSDIINYTDITSIADNYKLKSVYVRIMPSFTQVGLPSIYNYPSLQWDIDKDDGALPTVDLLRQKMGVTTRTFKPGQYIGIKIAYPNIQASVADSTGTTSAMPIGNRWLDAADVNVPHLGLKGVFSNVDLPASGTAKIAFKFDVAYTLEAKNLQ